MKGKFSVFVIAVFSIVGFAMMHAGNVAAEQELTVSAAASLTNAFPEIRQKIREHLIQGRRSYFNFAASGPLFAANRAGRPG